VFIGYSELHKGYKCLHISTGRVYISRDVIFDGHVFPFSKLPENASCSTSIDVSTLLIPSPTSLTGHYDDVTILAPGSTNMPARNPDDPIPAAGGGGGNRVIRFRCLKIATMLEIHMLIRMKYLKIL
jgi:hypothetical protein